MLAHVTADVALAYPIQGAFQKVLTIGAATNISTPFLDVGILTVAEFRLGERHKRAGINGVEQFLAIERHPALSSFDEEREKIFCGTFCPRHWFATAIR